MGTITGGIHRYNIFSNNFSDPITVAQGLKSNSVTAVHFDHQTGILWTATPGHIQYTRNMVTGASTANLAILLIDARHGVVEQTKRHAFIASLLQIPHIAVCINKMDLVDYKKDESKYCLLYTSPSPRD